MIVSTCCLASYPSLSSTIIEMQRINLIILKFVQHVNICAFSLARKIPQLSCHCLHNLCIICSLRLCSHCVAHTGSFSAPILPYFWKNCVSVPTTQAVSSSKYGWGKVALGRNKYRIKNSTVILAVAAWTTFRPVPSTSVAVFLTSLLLSPMQNWCSAPIPYLFIQKLRSTPKAMVLL